MRASTFFAAAAALAGTALAHVELVNPFPILSPQNPAVHWSNRNYDMMAPLIWEGDNLPYPCKGYLWSTAESERVSQKSWPAGSWQTLSFGRNGAPHRGGSCQLSLSYDYGETWQVIYSYIGGCMIEGWDWDFQLPSEAPSGEAVFSWSWFNHEGNREMYQNCAIITVTGGGSGLNTRDFPAPFVANANVNGCSTVHGQDVVFPNPGRNVKWSGPYSGGWRPDLGYAVIGDNCVDWNAGRTPAGSNGQTGNEPAPAPAPSSTAAPTTTSSSAWSEPTPTRRPGDANEFNAAPLSSSTAPAPSPSAAEPAPAPSAAPTPAPPSGTKCTKRKRRSTKNKKRHAKRKAISHRDLAGLKARHVELARKAIEQIEAHELA